MSRKGQSITLSISERDKAQLEAIALELGMTWGERPNISKLVEAIARGKLSVAPNHDWSQPRIEALNRALKALVDTGQVDRATEIAQLLIERSELSIPFRAEVERFLGSPPPAWAVEINRRIRQQQPFRLSYRDAADREWNYTVLHAKIAFREKRHYLECRCEESRSNQEVPELAHNWSLRLDRITEAAVVSADKAWLPDLDRLEVVLHLKGGLAFSYERKPEDLEVSWLDSDPPVKQVRRMESNIFWLLREVLPYAENCEIVSPASVRERFKQQIQALYSQYFSS
ncbi:WYL domain-containing protein [Kamptonema formosum]|uniref:WYL domain-containing protein n=1 Tax=Kamptonema formosum TaxID=331992 RepID=UPI000348B9EA|nr:WYL domain-containing protein [Oscillatoria sp. PCC 10802]